MNIAGIILAAGKGTRMKSNLPKVLHQVGDRPMLESVGRALSQAGVAHLCVVASHELLEEGADLFAQFPEWGVVIQKEQKGTADAVASAAYALDGVSVPPYASGAAARGEKLKSAYCLICNGDTPAMAPDVLQKFISECVAEEAELAVLGMNVPDPYGYGRILKDEIGRLQEIVEEKDADDEIRRIKLVNTGVVFARTSYLFELLREVVPGNKQGEYYLTDCFGLARKRGHKPLVCATDQWQGFSGVNDLVQLAAVEEQLVRARIEGLQRLGTRVQLPSTVYIGLKAEIGVNSSIAAHVSISGQSRIGSRCRIGHGAVLVDCAVGDDAVIGVGAVLKGVTIDKRQRVPAYQVKEISSCAE
jgi:bifunctional UDP-N-acetylglucosamine pyrophosphorylase / glucosamine-1-phosphate N-acetyltransferase